MTDYFAARNVSPDTYATYTIPSYLSELLAGNKELSILDFGCGFGQMLIGLRGLGFTNIQGVDINEHAIDYCRSQGLKVEDCKDFGNIVEKFKGKCDLVVMSHVLEHITKEEIIPTLKKLKLLLSSSGALLIMVPNGQSNTNCYWAYEDFTHTTLFTAGSIFYVLRMAGFEKVEFVDIDCCSGLSKYRKSFRRILLRLYNRKIDFWNRVTSSSFHNPSPRIYSYEIKVLAK